MFYVCSVSLRIRGFCLLSMALGRQASMALEVVYEHHEAEETEASLKGRTEKERRLKKVRLKLTYKDIYIIFNI